MSREPILVCLGILVALAPFSGFPLSWLYLMLPLLGFLIALVGVTLVLRKNRISISSHESPTHADA